MQRLDWSNWPVKTTSARRLHRRTCTSHRRQPAVAPEKLGSLRSRGWRGASTEPGGGHGNGHFPTCLGGSTSRVAHSAAQTAAVKFHQGCRGLRQDHRQLVIGHSGCTARAHAWSLRVICVPRDGRIGSHAYGTWGGRKCRARARGATSVCLSVFSPCFPCCCYKSFVFAISDCKKGRWIPFASTRWIRDFSSIPGKPVNETEAGCARCGFSAAAAAA